jgi:hypothetical protein
MMPASAPIRGQIYSEFNAHGYVSKNGGIKMKTTEELLYQIRGLARIVVAFSFCYQGLVPKWLSNDVLTQQLIEAHGSTFHHMSWLSHVAGLFEIMLAAWLILAFTDKKPLWLAGASVVIALLDTLFFAPVFLINPFNVLIVNLALLALIAIDLLILRFDPSEIKAHQVGQYLRFTRDRMLYEFVKRLELKDLPHLVHTLTQLRLKRRNKNRLKQKSLLKQSGVDTSSRRSTRPPEERRPSRSELRADRRNEERQESSDRRAEARHEKSDQSSIDLNAQLQDALSDLPRLDQIELDRAIREESPRESRSERRERRSLERGVEDRGARPVSRFKSLRRSRRHHDPAPAPVPISVQMPASPPQAQPQPLEDEQPD